MSRLISIIVGSLLIIISFYFGFKGNEKVIEEIHQKHTAPKNFNHLSKEKSPYLLESKNSPIFWYPWSQEAFMTALDQKKNVFLHIGSTDCSLCQKMEREVFFDSEVISLLNDEFISIKVDYREHPELVTVYKSAVKLIADTDEYPLNLFLTADLKPFFGQTQFDKETFITLLKRVSSLWKTSPKDILESAEQIQKLLLQKNES